MDEKEKKNEKHLRNKKKEKRKRRALRTGFKHKRNTNTLTRIEWNFITNAR